MASWSAIVAVVEENKDAIENDGSRNWMELARCTTSTSATSRKAREIALIPAPFGSFLAALIFIMDCCGGNHRTFLVHHQSTFLQEGFNSYCISSDNGRTHS